MTTPEICTANLTELTELVRQAMHNSNGSHPYLQAFFPGLGTLLLALATFRISLTQREIAANKYKLDFSDKRAKSFAKLSQPLEFLKSEIARFKELQNNGDGTVDNQTNRINKAMDIRLFLNCQDDNITRPDLRKYDFNLQSFHNELNLSGWYFPEHYRKCVHKLISNSKKITESVLNARSDIQNTYPFIDPLHEAIIDILKYYKNNYPPIDAYNSLFSRLRPRNPSISRLRPRNPPNS